MEGSFSTTTGHFSQYPKVKVNPSLSICCPLHPKDAFLLDAHPPIHSSPPLKPGRGVVPECSRPRSSPRPTPSSCSGPPPCPYLWPRTSPGSGPSSLVVRDRVLDYTPRQAHRHAHPLPQLHTGVNLHRVRGQLPPLEIVMRGISSCGSVMSPFLACVLTPMSSPTRCSTGRSSRVGIETSPPWAHGRAVYLLVNRCSSRRNKTMANEVGGP